MNDLQEKFIQGLLPFLEYEGSKPKSKQGKHTFPCPFCAAKRRTRGKRRSHSACLLFVADKGFTYRFYCQYDKCPVKSGTFHDFLKAFNPELHRRYLKEKEHRGSTGKGHNAPKVDYESLFKDQTKDELKRRRKQKHLNRQLRKAWDELSPSMKKELGEPPL